MTRPRESGMALLVVLWTLLLIGIIGASINGQARKQGMLSRNGAAMARAEAAAEGGIIRAIAALTDPRPEQAWRADGSIHRFALDGLPIEIRIVDEAGKVDVNAAPPEAIASLLQICGASPDSAFSIAESIADVRRGIVTGKPRGFETISEILGIPGVTPPLYERAAPFITVLTHSAGVDPSVAPPELLAALAGRDPSLAPTIDAARNASPGTPAPALPQNGYLSASQHAIFTIEAVAWDGPFRFGRQATIRLTHNSEVPYLVHLWGKIPARSGRPDQRLTMPTQDSFARRGSM